MSNLFEYKIAKSIYSKITDGTHDSPKQQEVGKPLITSKHIKGRNIDFATAYLISEEDYSKINERSKVDKWDVIVSMIGEYCGFCYIERNDIINYAVKNVGIFKTGSELEAEWLYYYLNSPIGKGYLNSLKSGSSQPYLTLGTLRNLPILQPKTLGNKINIVKVLSDLDAKIELNNKINSDLEAMAKTLYDYWFVQFDFPDADGKPFKTSGGKMVWNEELKRDIPEGWEVKRLDKIMRIVRGASPRPIEKFMSPSGIPWIKISDATKSNNRFILFTKEFIKKEGVSKSRELFPGTLILSNSASPGIPKIVTINACVHDGWLIVDSFKESFYNEFMYHYFENFRSKILNMGTGSIFKNLKTEYIKELMVAVPPKDLMVKSEKVFKNMSDKILLNAKENQQLASLRDWLLPMLMNGQVRVGDVEEDLAMVAEPNVKYKKGFL